MTLWQATIAAQPALDRWIKGSSRELHVARLPRPAWAIVAGSVARAFAERGRSVLVLAPAPERFAAAAKIRPYE